MNTPRISVIGDIMLDVDLHCVCERLCQEGPWPVLRVERIESRPGGAGNVAEMCLALGCQTIVLGFEDGSEKRRMFVDGKLVGPRVDHDQQWKADEMDVEGWMAAMGIFQPNAIIVADHGKGVVTDKLMSSLSKLSVPLFVDPVPTTPINSTVECICGGTKEIPEFHVRPMVRIEKRGADGLKWQGRNFYNWTDVSSTVTNARDPLGAGDQFIATLAWRRCLGDSWADAIHVANFASGLQCQRPGCDPVTSEELDVVAIRESISSEKRKLAPAI
jgi:D-beta-D-heptose 7-phosphate kinase/D-beta-D-heptose 1-phosphate adenosyltransferase